MCSLQQTYEAKRQEFLVELQRREDEMRQMFVQRVKEKESELKEAEREVRRPTGTGSRHLVSAFGSSQNATSNPSPHLPHLSSRAASSS